MMSSTWLRSVPKIELCSARMRSRAGGLKCVSIRSVSVWLCTLLSQLIHTLPAEIYHEGWKTENR
jgi:hypothetical protein